MRNRKSDIKRVSIDDWPDVIVTNKTTAISIPVYFYDPVEGEEVEDTAVSIVERDKEDEFDPQVGYNIAYFKALRDFANRQLRRHHNHLEMEHHNRLHSEMAAVRNKRHADNKAFWKLLSEPTEEEKAVTDWFKYLASLTPDEFALLDKRIANGDFDGLAENVIGDKFGGKY